MVPVIRVFASAEELAWHAAERFVTASEEAIVATGRFAVALSGGGTPQRMYQLLASPELSRRIDWPKTHILFSDERCVAANHPDSNFRMACEALLDHVPIPYDQVHRMAGEIDPQAAADQYETIIQRDFAKGLDLVLLGIGEDGHTASLFPGAEALATHDRACIATFVPKLAQWRLSLSVPYLCSAFEAIVLGEGLRKNRIVEDSLQGFEGPAQFPVQMIQPNSGRLIWMLDAAAAGMLADDDDDGGDVDSANMDPA